MNRLKTLFLILTIAFGFLSILTFLPYETLGFEIRVKEYILLYDGPIQFSMISATSFLFVIYSTLRKNKNMIIAFSINTILFLGLAYLFAQFGFGPQVKEDRIVYRNKLNESEKLIFQYYETGIGGNPNWKAVTTNNISAKIRRVKNIKIRPLREKVDIGDHSINLEKLPSEIELNENVFELERVVVFYSDSVINYK